MLLKTFRWLRSIFSGGRHDLNELARRLDLSVDEIKNVDLSYREFQIAKKSGKPRNITAPNDDLKRIQRRMLKRLLKKLKSHPLATGFEKGVSFVDNARIHQSQAIVIRIDLIDFFPSIPECRVHDYFRRIGWNRKAAKTLASLTTYNGSLPQGAPTSPRLSNLVHYLFDWQLDTLARKYDGIYTRYADDITISLGDPDANVHDLVERLVKLIRVSGFRPHMKKKFDVRRQHHRQIVTGLVVNETAKLPRETRRWLRAVEHRTEMQKRGGVFSPRPTLTEEQLQGWQSLRGMIEQSRDQSSERTN